MNISNPKVDFIFEKPQQWQQEFKQLRNIALSTGLNEDLKWGQACYMLGKSNVVLIHGFKEYCALLFFKGALLNNDHGLLIKQSDNVQSARQIRFTHIKEIEEQASILKRIIHEAVEIEKAGLKVELKKTEDFETVAEFQYKLDKIPELKTAFEALTPGRQRAYKLYFSQAKQSKTREARVEKYIPLILNGKGLND
ncbi:YdeI family protein [Mucilaginibacter puniceus]